MKEYFHEVCCMLCLCFISNFDPARFGFQVLNLISQLISQLKRKTDRECCLYLMRQHFKVPGVIGSIQRAWVTQTCRTNILFLLKHFPNFIECFCTWIISAALQSLFLPCFIGQILLNSTQCQSIS